MRSNNIRIIATITIFAAAIVFALGSIAVIRSTNYIKAEINGKIAKTTEDYASDFSTDLNHMVGLTDSLTAYVVITLDKDMFTSGDTSYVKTYRKQLADYIRSSLQTSEYAHSLYVTFNPDLTEVPEEVWFVLMDEKLQRIYADLDKRNDKFKLPYEDDMAYYFRPQESEEEFAWTGLYYDKDVGENMFSYSRAIYIGDTFIGVAGADVTADSTVEIIRNMSLYERGNAVLFDEKGQSIVASEGIEEKEISQLSAQMNLTEDGLQEESGIMIDEDTKNIIGYARMDNGWTLVTTQPEAEAYAPIRHLVQIMIMLGILMGAALSAFMILLTRPLVRRTDTLEQENRAKDIMLADQSRQARIGEMFGNITHQWKQPLNTIRLIMANLLDSYRYNELDEKRLENSVQKVDLIIDNMTDAVRDFSDFLKPSKEKMAFDINDSIRGAVSLMEESLNRHRIRVNVSCKGRSEVFGYPNEMTHAIFNVLNNARDAILEEPTAQREIDVVVSTEGKNRILSVFNDGKPLSAEAIAKAGEPYFTTKKDSGGTGLGLYITKQIIEEHMGGRISLRNTGGRICCRIVIPVKESTAEVHADRRES